MPESTRSTADGEDAFSVGNADETLDAIVRYSGDCVKVLDLDGRVLQWNAVCEDLYGWRASEVLGTKLPFIPEHERLGTVRDMRAIASQNAAVEREARSLRSDGSLITLRSTIIPLQDSDGHAAATLSITREYGHDTRLTRQHEHFASAVSRQLSDPVTAILGFSQLLRRPEILEDPHRRERTVRALAERAGHLSMLLDDLLVVFESEDGELSLTLGPVDPGALLAEVVARVSPAESRLLLDFDASLTTIVADRRRLVQAISCLVDNALRFSPASEAVSVSVYRAEDEVVVEVTDTGCGIDLAEQRVIFDRFYHGAAAYDAWPGVGIGLYLVRIIANAHGGSIAVASKRGEGSTFTFRLPLNRQPKSEKGNPDD